MLLLAGLWIHRPVAAATAIPNSATGSIAGTPLDLASAGLTINRVAIDLSLAKTVDNATPLVGTNVVFTVTVTNAAGQDNATGVVVTDALPTGYSLVSHDGGPAYDGTTWTVGNLNAGASAVLNVTATVNASGNYTNAAEVTAADQTDIDSTPGDGSGDDYDTEATTPGAAIDLSLAKTVDSATPLVGTNVVFTVTVSNAAGQDDATGVVVTDALPTGYTLVGHDGGPAYDGTTWTVGNLTAGTDATLNVTATVNVAGDYTNAAEVTAASEADIDSTPGDGGGDDYDTESTTPGAAIDLSLSKTVDNATPLVGTNVVFSVTVSNAAGQNDATGVVVTDALPTGYTLVGHDGGPAYDGTTWTVGNLNAGTDATLNITATVNASGNYTNAAEVTAAGQTDIDSTPGDGGGDDYDTQATTPGAAIDLSLTKTVDNATPLVGTNVVFSVTVANAAGQDNATGVVVTDALPTGYTLVSHDGGPAYDGTTWNVGNLNAGASATLNVTARVIATGNYTNAAEVTAAGQTDIDSTPGDGGGDDYDTEATTPGAAIDLSLAKTVDNATPLIGTNVVFTLTAANAAGQNDATGVVVTDALPTGYTLVGHDGGPAYDGTTWNIGNLNAGASAVLNVTAKVNVSGDYTNVAEVTAVNETDIDSTPGDGGGDDYDTEATTPGAAIDLSLTKTVDNATPLIGTNVIFTLTVSNAAGQNDATGVVVTDALPTGYTLVGHDGGPAYDGTTWTVGNLNAGASATLNITATVNPAGNYTNAAEVTAAGETDIDSTPGDGGGDDYDTEATTPGAAIDLSLTKTVDNATPLVGTNVVFSVTVANAAGQADATGVVITDALPTGYTLVGHDGGPAYDGTTWTVGNLNAGASATLNVTARVIASGNYTNAAEVTAAGQTDIDSTPGDGSGDDFDTEATTPSAAIDLSLTKTVDNATPLIGTNVIFTLTASNAAGQNDATGVVVTDALPTGYTLVGHDGGPAYDGTTWNVGNLNAGASATLNVTATVNASGDYTNVAEVTAAGETDIDSTPGDGSGDDFDTEATTPGTAIDLSLAKTVDTLSPLVGANVIFTITATNAAGQSNATGVVVTDALPTGYTLVGHDGGPAYDGTTWTVGNLNAGASAVLNVTATVNASGNYTNAAEVTAAGQTDIDSTPGDGSGDDFDTEATTPSAAIDLSLTKTVDNATPLIGTNVIFTLTASNAAGQNDATGVVVTDALPTGYTLVGHDGGPAYDGTTWNVGNLNAGASATLNVTATVNASGDYTNVAEVTAAGETDIDSTPGDGSGDDFDTEATTPGTAIDLSLAKTVDTLSPLVGANVIFTITATNAAGQSNATGVVVTDALPTGYTLVGHDGGPAYDGTTWTVGNLNAGASAVLNVTATVNASGNYTNAAEVTAAGQTDIDSTPGDGSGDDYDTQATTPGAAIDLSLTKTVDNATPLVGTNVVFTVTVANAAGQDNATGVVVTDALPTGYSLVSHDGGPAYDGTTWTVGSLNAGASAVLNVTATVNASGNYTNAAEVTAAGQTDIDSTPGDGGGDDYDTEATTPSAAIDLSLAKTVDNATPLVGTNVVFTVTVSNAAGQNDATGVVVADALPTGYTLVGHDGGPAYDGTTWNVGNLNAGTSATLNITATVNPAGNYTNTAEVTAAGETDIDSTPGDGGGDDYDTEITTPGAAIDLSLAKTVDNATPLVGSNVVFTVSVANAAGQNDATGVVVTDALPTGYTLVGHDGGPAYDGTTWNVGNLNSGASSTLNITATVNPAGNYTNVAEVTAAGQTDIDSTPGDGSGDDHDTEATTPGAAIDLSLTKTVDNATPLVGTNVVFTITVANAAGQANATGVVVTDALPTGYTLVGHDGGPTYDGTTWNVGNINAGTSSTLNITATVNAAGNYTNAAEVTAAAETDIDSTPGDGSGDDYDTEATTPGAAIDLSLTKTVDNATPLIGTNVVFTITVANAAGQTDASGVVVTDALPTGYTLVGHDGGPAYDGTTWTVGNLNAGASATLNITATVNASGNYLNVAEVTAAGETDIDSTPGDGSGDDHDTETTTPGAAIDLSLTKTVDNATPLVGTNVVFTITVANAAGQDDASGVVVTDALPTGYTLVGHDGGPAYDGTTWNVGNLNAGATATLNVTATVLGSGIYTNAAEVSAAGQTDIDSTPGDGSGDDYDTEATTPGAAIDLSLSKTVDNATPAIGTNVVFTLTATNAGGVSDATGVVVTDALPTGYTLVGHDGGPTYDGTTWNVGNLNASASSTLNITATVNASGNYTNVAEVTAAGEPDVDSTPGDGAGDDYDTESTTPGAAVDLSLTKTVDNATPLVGTDVVFTITVANAAGQSDATGVVVTDALPTGYTLVGHDGGPAYDGTTWNVGNLNSGASATLNITATVNPAGNYTNVAEVTAAGQTDIDSTPGDGSGDDHDTEATTPGAAIDLSLTKTVDNATPLVGTNVVFTITVSNAAGQANATGVVVTDALPTGYTLVGHDGGPTYDGTTWNVGNINAGTSSTLNITATVNAAGNYTNAAEVTAAAETDIDSTPGDGSGDDYDTEATTPGAAIDLSLTKTVDNATPLIGTNVVFTITVANAAGQTDASGVVVTDALPTGYTLVGHDGGPAYDGTTWTVGNLNAGASATLNITATVNASGNYLNVAEVTAAGETDIDSTPGDGSGDDHDTETTTPGAAIDLSLTKTVDNATPLVGTNVVFTITVANAAGQADATGVVVTDALPTGYTLVGHDGGPAYDGTTWNVGNLNAGATATLNVTATVLGSGIYTNVAEVTAAGETDIDSTPGDGGGDDYDTEATTPGAAIDLSLSKTVDNATPAIGTNVVFTLTATNAGGVSDATGVVVTDALPTGYTLVGHDGGPAYDGTTWNVGNLGAGASATLNVTATVNPAGDYTNVAEVTAAGEPDVDSTPGDGSGDDYDTESTTPGAAVDLSLTKTVDNATPLIGTNVVFTITVANAAGQSDATGVVVTDALPTGYTLVGHDGGPAYDGTTWNVGNLSAGASATLNVTATVNPAGNYTNVAEVTAAGQTDIDSTPGDGSGDDFDTAAVTPTPASDLSLVKTVDVSNPAVGATVVFTVTVNNSAGSSDATGVVVTDALPTGYNLVSHDGGPTYDGTTWNVGAVNAGAARTLNISATVNPTGDYTNVAEVSAADQADPDSTPGDGSGDDHDTEATAPASSIDLALVMTVDNPTPAVGSNVTFSLTLSAAATLSDATGVVVTDALPTGYTLVGHDGGPAYDGTTWNVGNLNAGASTTLNIIARVNAAGDHTNVAEVSAADQNDVDSTPGNAATTPEDDDASATTVPTATIDLSLTKTVDNATPTAGNNVVFTLTVSNDAALSDATGVAVGDSLPSGYTLVGHDGGAAYDGAIWTVGDLTAGSSRSLNITARVEASGNYGNEAQVTAAVEPDIDSIPGNGFGNGEDDQDTQSTAPRGTDGTVDITDLARPGEPLTVVLDDADLDTNPGVAETFTLSVVNDVTGESESLLLTETGVSTGVFQATLATTFGTVAGADDDGTINVQAGDTITAAYNDALTSTGGGSTTPATDATTVVGGVDGSVDITDSARPGDTLTVTVQDADLDTNPGLAETLVLTAVNDVTLESETLTLTETGLASGVFSGTVDTVFGATAGTDDDGTFNANAGDTITATYDDALTASGGTATITDSSTIAVESIVLDKRASRAEVVVGSVVGYVISAENTLAAPLNGVILTDLIPVGFKFVENSARLIRSGAETILPASGSRPVTLGPIDFAAGETLEVRYLLRVGSGVQPGLFVNDVTPNIGATKVGNTAQARVEVQADPVFDQSVIIGKVFEDRNRNRTQDPGEPGLPGAMIALDNGTYALTDEHGRYHVPAVDPGQRLLKINRRSLPAGSIVTTDEAAVIWVSPGLLSKVNFGVAVVREAESIGRRGRPALSVVAEDTKLPVELRGSAEALSLVVNGQEVELPTAEVRLGRQTLDDVVHLKGSRLDEPVRFALEIGPQASISQWTLGILDSLGRRTGGISGTGTPPQTLSWDGRNDDGTLIDGGRIYQYQLELSLSDGAVLLSPRQLFGVDRATVVSLDLTGDAFAFGKAELSRRAKRNLERTAEILAGLPEEKVVIEGHTDSVGSSAANLKLSRRRAEAARTYLTGTLGLPEEQFVIRWYGEERPIASNVLEEGRSINRRVEIRGEVNSVEQARILDAYRTTPRVRINGQEVRVEDHGRFASSVDHEGTDPVQVELSNSAGRSTITAIAIPTLDLAGPRGSFTVPRGGSVDGCSSRERSAGDEDDSTGLLCRIHGRTNPGNTVELDGELLDTGLDGSFSGDVWVAGGRNTFGLLARNEQGFSRIVNLAIDLADRDEHGQIFVTNRTVPQLTVNLPLRGTPLLSSTLGLTGTTDPGNRVEVNDQALEVAGDGRFSGTIELPRGRSDLSILVTDPAGNVGTIERKVEVARHELFLMAFADGEFGQRTVDGLVEASGYDDGDEFYAEGRLAFYLKGVISGRYLITAAFDSGKHELGDLFKDLDGEQTDRLLTNLDPDKYYPVYGDTGTVVYDTESQGKLYLALESDQIDAVIGNSSLVLGDTELAAYRRAFYGARFGYRSLARTRYGRPDTEVLVFGAEVRQAHVRDELRATGGSVYFLSHQEIVEGTERVTLVHRDKTTGLVLRRQEQRQNIDYTVKYEEGRLMFHRPLSSVADGGSLVDENVLGGHPVFLEVDYETRLDQFEKTAAGARVRRQIGDHVSVGGTYVEDELEGGPYDLTAVDAEVRLGQNTRLTAEFADSSGTDSLTFVSNDGGLTYEAVATSGMIEGSAWKAAAELDVGEWFGSPNRYRVNFYLKELEPGFKSAGSYLEQGTRKMGLNAALDVTARDSIQIRHDRENLSDPATATPGAVDQSTVSSVNWEHKQDRWHFNVEYFDRLTEDSSGIPVQDSSFGAARFWSRVSDRLNAELTHQQTLSGAPNDRTTLGLQYKVMPSLALEARGSDGTLGSSAQAGAILTLGQSEIYLTERLVDDTAGRKNATIVGARSPFGDSSRVYSEYQIEGSDDGDRTVSLLGLQKQWDAGPGVRFLLSGETASVDAAAADTDRTTLSASISYADPERLTALSRNEIRYESGDQRRVQFVTLSQFDLRLGPDFTLLAKYRYSKTRDRDQATTQARFEERSLGLAFRPVENDRFNAIARYTRLFDQRPLSLAGVDSSDRTMDVVSVDSSFQVSRRIEWVGKGAVRLQQENLQGLDEIETNTLLAVQRFNLNLWRPLYLGVEYRMLTQDEADDQRQGWLSEVSWKLQKHFRVGFGYNFTDFSDNEFSQNDYSVRGWFFRVQGLY